MRQLAYEFKPWRKLEATGRAGSDEGFDARGWEIVGEADVGEGESESSEEEPPIAVSDRLWLIQCKREKAIGPTRLQGYLEDLPEGERGDLYGIVLAAACDFSKKARDGFHKTCADFGVSESYLWGKAELEDMLFQPKNDHLLFAYFGFSLTIRRRSLRTELRARLVMKRKAYRVLAAHGHQSVLLRDPQAHQYPDHNAVPDFDSKPSWKVFTFDSFTHEGIKFKTRRSFAYIADDGKSWDVAFSHNDETVDRYENPWAPNRQEQAAMRGKIFEAWGKLPDRNKAWLEVFGIVPYEAVLDIDEKGDDIVEVPHIYVPFDWRGIPFKVFYASIQNTAQTDTEHVELYLRSDTEDRIAFFAEEFRRLPGGTSRPQT